MNKRNIDKKDNTNARHDKDKNNIQKEDLKKAKEDNSKHEDDNKKTKANSKSKNNSGLKDQKIKDAFVFSNKITVLKKKTARDSKSKPKPDEDDNIPRSKRSRIERSHSKKKERDESEEQSEEEVPTNLKKKTVKIQKKKQEKSKDIEEEDEIEEVTVTKNSKKKNSHKSKEETSSKKRAKSVPEKTNKRSKRSAKDESDLEKEAEDEEESEEEWEEDEKIKKSNNTAKKSGKSQNQKKSKNVSKKTNQNTKYKRGKENPIVEIQSSCKYLESKEPYLLTDCCVHCNNRNVIRAVIAGNNDLLKKSIGAKDLISSINDEWSKEYPVTSIELAIIRGDKSMISEIITNQMNLGKIYDRVSKPIHKITEAETGESSIYAFGVKTRKLNMTRGNRIGNNAFLDDNSMSNNFQTTIINTILQKCKDPKLIDYITAAMTDPLNKNNSFVGSSLDFNSQLHLAVAAGNRIMAHFLLERMIKNNINANYGYNQLHCSVLEYKDDKFDVSHKASLNKKTIGNMTTLTPVGVACINPKESVLKRLIDLGGDWHFADFNGYKPIHNAAACEGPGPLKLLLSMGAHVDEPTKDKTTPLIIASKYGRLENVKLLLKSKANILHKSKKGNTALHEAAENGHVELLRTILEQDGVSIDLPGKDRMTPLIIASAHGNKDCVNVLLDSGAKILKKDKFKRTALLIACKSGQTVIASILLRHGSDFNLADSSSNSPLHYACAYGWLEIVKLLIQAGANVNSTNMWKISPLEVAMLKNHFGIVKFLLNNSQVDVNMKFDKSNTLLHHSFTKVTDKSLTEIEYLICEKKADPNIQNIYGKACIHLLAEYNFYDYLINNSPNNTNKRFNHNNQELKSEDLANLKLNHTKIIKRLFEILISNGAQINLKSVDNKSALQISIEKRNYVMIELILDSNPEILFVDSTNQTILHLLSDLVFDEEGKHSLNKMIDVIMKNKNIKSLANIVDNNGFTPILKLFYFYSKNVKMFFDKIQAKETLNLKTYIYNQSLKLENQANDSNMNGMIISNNDDMDEFEEENRFPTKKKTAMPSAKWSNLGKVAIKYGIDSSNNENEADKINKLVLTSEDIKTVLEKSREICFEYIHKIFIQIVFSLISIGCDPHSQVQKIKKWRDRKEGEVITEEEQQDVNNNQSAFKITFNSGFNFNNKMSFNYGYSKMALPAVPSKSASFGKIKARRNALREKPVNNVSKTKVKHDIANEFYDGVGSSNVIMLLMSLPIADLLKYFVEELKVDVNITDIYEQNSLFYLIKNYPNIEEIFPEAFNKTIDQVLKYNIKVNQFDRDGNSTFFLLSKLWNIDQMTKFYNYGANINKMNKHGENALIYYIRKKEKYKVELLLKNFNIDINYKDDKMRTAVHYLYNDEESSADIDVSLKQMILSKNPDINAKDIMKRTPLHYLFVKIGKEFDKSHIDPIVALSTLLDIKGIEINAPDIFGNTPLHYASQRGATICAMSLIQKTNINTKNNEGNTPLGYSLLFKHPNFSIVLIQQNALIYDNVYPLQNRSEEDIIKREKKADRNLSQTMLNISQPFDLNTSSQFDLNNSIMPMSDNNLGFNPQTELNQAIVEESDESDIDDDDDDDDVSDDDNNTYNQAQTNTFITKAPRKNFGLGFNNYKYNNFNGYNTGNEEKSETLNYKELNSNYFKSKENREKGISMFRMCVKNEYQGLTYLFVNQGYDLMKAIQDAFYENKFNLAMLLLDKSPYDEIYRSTNEKQQNLFHILALFGKSVQNKRELDLFLDKLSEKGVRLDLPDVDGYTPIHYACENHFEDLFEYIINKHQPNKVLCLYTNSGYTPFICSIKGKHNISKSFKHMELILNQVDKQQISLLYYEEYYGESYQCTPLLHATRSFLEKKYKIDPILTEEGKKLIKLIQYGASVMEKDSNGIDCLMHCVKENNLQLLQLFVQNCKNHIIYDAIDFSGRSLVHYAISPLPEGSFENENLLCFLIENGFACNIKDIHGRTPYDYASEQMTGNNLKVLKRFKVAPQETVVMRRQKSIILSNDWPQSFVNFEKDAEEYYHKMSSILSAKQEIKILPDPNGNFPEDTHEVIKDNVCGYWDIIMTKVKVHAGLYGEYNFYKMQLIHDKGRDVYILWNRFGRIGEVGQYQRTPFTTLQEAQSEFKKIFKSKSGNEWENKSNFKRIRGKYMLLHINEWKISHKDLLEPFDFKKSPESSISNKEIKNLIKNLTNSAIYYKALSDSGIDTDLLNFNYLNKELIIKARSILGEINKIMQEIALLKEKKNTSGHYDEDIINKVLDFKNEIYELSSRYYELIPKSKFKNMAVSALDNESQLKEEILLLENLTYVENAVKILLAAQYRQNEINPIDYCLNSMNILIDMIDKKSNEYGLLEKFTKQNSNEQFKIMNIFKIQRKGEAENILQMSIPNHLLLFHGSKIFNFIGILSNGLKIAPPEAPATGYMFGKGVYFADMFDKSYGYCDSFESDDDRGKKKKQKYMLMCEVALGKTYEVGVENEFDPELTFLKNGYQSLKSLAREELDPNGKFVMNNGVIIPLGKNMPSKPVNNQIDRRTYHTEYVVYDTSQIRMRYLIQIEDERH